jgi:hypothetical protein
MDDSVRHEHGIDVAGYAGGVVGQGHGGAAHDEHISHDPSAGEALTQGGEGLFQFRPAQEDIVGLGHAASRSLAER